MSVLLRPEVAPAERHLVVLAAAVAMAEAVESTTGVHAVLKWPNDLLVGNRKLAGILAEAVDDAVVVGIGVNLDWPEVPEELADIATACNLERGRPTTREAVLEAFLERYAEHLDDLPSARRLYLTRLDTLGRNVRVERAEDAVVGIAIDVDDGGRLLVETDAGAVETISAGDVVHLRPV
jgi:BirA family biotin operon repressor/biotin-[acetyl-CoA-carboxylase] ligase